MQTEQNTIDAMFDDFRQRESETKQRLHNVRATTDKGAKPFSNEDGFTNSMQPNMLVVNSTKAIIKDLNQMHEDLLNNTLLNKKNMLILQSNVLRHLCKISQIRKKKQKNTEMRRRIFKIRGCISFLV